MKFYDRSKQLSLKLLDVALKNGQLADFVAMKPAYRIESRDLNGIVGPNMYFTMEAIYDYYRSNPNSGIDKDFYNSLIFLAQSYSGELMVERVLGIIDYQLNSEKSKSAPFEIDCQSVLNVLRNTIVANKAIYEKPDVERDNHSFWQSIEKYNEDFNQKYGRRVL